MAKYVVEHFQHGKLENEYTRLEGANFEITACSTGLSQQLDAIKEIPRSFKLSLKKPNLIEYFSGAYAYKPMGGGAIIAYFERSPSVEYSWRPFHFIQGHYAIIKPDLYSFLRGNIRQLFNIFTKSIPRYTGLTEIEPFNLNSEDLSANISPTIDDRVIAFASATFQEEICIFEHRQSSPVERLNFLTELVRCFPSSLRNQIPFITSFDPMLLPDTGGYRIAFDAEIAQDRAENNIQDTSLNLRFINAAPSVRKKDKGFHYVQFLREWKDVNLDDDLLDSLRFPNEISIDALDESALFERLYHQVLDKLEKPELIRESMNDDTIPEFIHTYGRFLNTSEAEFILDKVQEACTPAQSKALATLITNLYRVDSTFAFKGKVFEWFKARIQVADPDTIKQLYEHLLGVDQLFAEQLIQELVNSTDSDPTLLPIARTLYQLRVEKKSTNRDLFMLISSLIEHDSWSDVFKMPWWDFISYADFLSNLTKLAFTTLATKAPQTVMLLRDISQPVNKLPASILLDSYMETKNIEWLEHILNKALQFKATHLLNTSFFLGLTQIMRNPQLSDYAFSLLCRINFETLGQIAFHHSRNFTDLENVLVAARDFVIEVMYQQYSNSQTERYEVAFSYYYRLFNLLCFYLVTTSIPLLERDAKLDEWANAYRKRLSRPGGLAILEPDKLYAVLPFSALAKSFQYPQTYNLEVAKVKYEHMPTTEQYFYVWSSLIAYRARQSNFFPRKTFVASEIFSHLVQNLLKSDLRIMLTYFVEFSRQINFSSALKREWNSQLGSIPSLATQRASENGKEIVKALKDAYLTEEAQTIENSLNLMNLAINNAQELAQLLNEAERAVKKLIDYSNTKNLEFNTNRKITELQYYLRFLRRDTEVKNSIAVLRSLLEDSKIKRKLWDLLNRL